MWFEWGKNPVGIPRNICVACGTTERVTAWLAKDATKTGLQTSTTVRGFNFPLCEACNAILLGGPAAVTPIRRKSRLIAVPIAVAVCVLYALLSGDVPSSDLLRDPATLHLSFLFVLAWYVSYRLVFWRLRSVGGTEAERQDRARCDAIENSVRISLDFPRYGGRNKIGFAFADPSYRSAFQLLNGGSEIQP